MESRRLNVRTASERADEDDEKVKEKVGKEWIDDSGGEFWCGGILCLSNHLFLTITSNHLLQIFVANKYTHWVNQIFGLRTSALGLE